MKCDCCDAALVDWSLAIVAEKESFIRRLGKPEQCPVLALILQHYHYQWPNNRNSTSTRTKQGLYRSSTSFLLLSCLRLWHKISQKAGKLLAKVRENSEAQNLQNLPILCNPWISSAMAMAMSIYRTLCVLVYKIGQT